MANLPKLWNFFAATRVYLVKMGEHRAEEEWTKEGRGRCRGRGKESRAVEAVAEIGDEASVGVQNVHNVPMADQAVDLFAEFLQARGHGIRQPPPVPPVDPFRMSLLVRDLKKLGVKPFEGNVDHMKADRWIRNRENYFKILDMTSVEKRRAASFYLQDEARVWWDTVERSQKVDQMDWEGFLALFYKKYFPATVKEELQVEFLNLTQGSLTVMDYETRFVELSRFADPLSELQQAQKFQRGLNVYVKKMVTSFHHTKLVDVVECAASIEANHKEFQKSLDFKRDPKGKGKVPTQSNTTGNHGGVGKKQRAGYQIATKTDAQTKQAGSILCYNCNEVGHMLTNCTKPRVHKCFNCGQPEHMAKDCTQPRKTENKQGDQQGNARVFVVGLRQRNTGVEGIITLFHSFVRVLFDIGASHSFSICCECVGLTPILLGVPLTVESPLGNVVKLNLICETCPLLIGSKEFHADLIVLNNTYDVILGVDWLQCNHAVIDCYGMLVSFHTRGQAVVRYRCIKIDATMKDEFLARGKSITKSSIGRCS